MWCFNNKYEINPPEIVLNEIKKFFIVCLQSSGILLLKNVVVYLEMIWATHKGFC